MSACAVCSYSEHPPLLLLHSMFFVQGTILVLSPLTPPPTPRRSLPWLSNLLSLCLTSEFNPQIILIPHPHGSCLLVLFDALEGLNNYLDNVFDNNGSILMVLMVVKYIKLLNTVTNPDKVKSHCHPTLWYLRLPKLCDSWIIFLCSVIDRSTQTLWVNNKLK